MLKRIISGWAKYAHPDLIDEHFSIRLTDSVIFELTAKHA